MIESKLVKLLKTFSPAEIRLFKKFISSSYFNTNRDVVALFQFLEKQHPSFKPEKTAEEKAFNFIYGEKKYDDLRMRHLMSMLFKLAEDFLVVQNLGENEVSSGYQLMKTYRKRNLPKHFTASYRKVVDEQYKKQHADLFYYFDHYRMEFEAEDYSAEQDARRKHTNLQEVADCLDTFYIINKLKQSCAIVSHQNVFRQDYQLKLVNELLQHLATHQYKEPLIHLYYHGLLTLLHPENEDNFFQLKKQLVEMSQGLPAEIASELQVISRNYCVKSINSGKEKFVRELFELYRLGLNSKTLLDGKENISPSAYKNIVAVGLKLTEFDWTQSFINRFAQHLEKQYRGDYLSLNLAKLHFAKREYEQVLQQLIGMNYHDIFIALDGRTILLKTYYEMGEYAVLDSQLDSFRQFISRRKELSYHRSNYLNIIKYIKELMNLNKYSKADKKKFKLRLENASVLTEKSWLLDKLGRR